VFEDPATSVVINMQQYISMNINHFNNVCPRYLALPSSRSTITNTALSPPTQKLMFYLFQIKDWMHAKSLNVSREKMSDLKYISVFHLSDACQHH